MQTACLFVLINTAKKKHDWLNLFVDKIYIYIYISIYADINLAVLNPICTGDFGSFMTRGGAEVMGGRFKN